MAVVPCTMRFSRPTKMYLYINEIEIQSDIDMS